MCEKCGIVSENSTTGVMFGFVPDNITTGVWFNDVKSEVWRKSAQVALNVYGVESSLWLGTRRGVWHYMGKSGVKSEACEGGR